MVPQTYNILKLEGYEFPVFNPQVYNTFHVVWLCDQNISISVVGDVHGPEGAGLD